MSIRRLRSGAHGAHVRPAKGARPVGPRPCAGRPRREGVGQPERQGAQRGGAQGVPGARSSRLLTRWIASPILRAYLKEWGWEVKQFFAGVGADASEAELARVASRHPVFRILP